MTMTKQAYLRDENLLTLLSLHDFIIPEICKIRSMTTQSHG